MKGEVNTTCGLLDRRGDAAFLVLAGRPLLQQGGHLEVVKRGTVNLAQLAKVLVGVVPPVTLRAVIDMTPAALLCALEHDILP